MRNPRVLTEGALMLAIFTVLMLLSLYVPLIGTLAFFVLPLPLILFSSKYSIWNSILVLIGSLGLVIPIWRAACTACCLYGSYDRSGHWLVCEGEEWIR